MKQQFQNDQANKMKDNTNPDAATEKRINHVAEKAAEKAIKAEQCYDQDHTIISK